jgi:2'-5' RNA ligase
MIRLFAAIAVPEDIGEGLLRHQVGLDGARWRPLDAFHITLRFAGDIPENRADDLHSELTVIGGRPFDLTLAGVGAFGEGVDIHAVWAGVEESAELSHLAKACETACRRAGLEADTRAYKPHVTLAYLRRPDPTKVAAWIQAHNLLKSPSFRVMNFGLYSSWQTHEGSTYRDEALYPLG